MPPYSRDPSRGSAGVGFLALGPYFKIRQVSRDHVGVALTSNDTQIQSIDKL